MGRYIASRLNAIPGGQKEWKQWKKTWQDIKTKTKSKKAEINRYARGTGGGPPMPDLTPLEEKVINVIDPTVIGGDPLVNESAIEYIFEENDENLSETAHETLNKMMETNVIDKMKDVSNEENKKRKNEESRDNRRKRSTSNNRQLANSAEHSATLARISQERLEIQREYYNKKILLLGRQTRAIKELVALFQSRNTAGVIGELITIYENC